MSPSATDIPFFNPVDISLMSAINPLPKLPLVALVPLSVNASIVSFRDLNFVSIFSNSPIALVLSRVISIGLLARLLILSILSVTAFIAASSKLMSISLNLLAILFCKASSSFVPTFTSTLILNFPPAKFIPPYIIKEEPANKLYARPL